MSGSVKNYVKEFRKKLGLTQQDLAERVGVSRQSIIAIEKGHYIPSLPLALKFSRFFKRPINDLFELEGE